MNSSPVSSGEHREQRSAFGDKKRKRSKDQDTSVGDRPVPPKQQSIQDLFVASEKHSHSSHNRPELSPSSKRRKSDAVTLAAPPSSKKIPLTPEKMYSFSSKQTSGSTVIDLTKTPPRNGQSRRLSNGVKPITTMNPHQGAKKLVVKNLKRESAWDPEKYLDQVWTQVDAALTRIFSQDQSSFSMEDLYRGVENVCKQGLAKKVYERLHERCRRHLSETVLVELQKKSAQDNVATLNVVLNAWSAWTTQVTTIRGIFYYMDRSYLLQQSKTTLNDVCVDLFRNTIFNDQSLKDKVVDGACELISADREQKTNDMAILRRSVSMFHDLATYTSSYEPRLLAVSQTYIVNWTEETSSEQTLSGYVKACDDLITREMDRCEMFSLDTSTKRDLLALLEDHLVERKTDHLTAQAGLDELLDKNAVDDLSGLYSLLQRRRLGQKLKKPFSKWVEETGTKIVFDDKASEDMVVRLLSLKRRLDNMWRTSFQRDPELGHGLREAFETFINKTKKGDSTWGTDNSKTGEMIAKYLDILLRGGSKAIPTELTVAAAGKNDQDEDDDRAMDEDTEVNAQLDQVLDIFRFIHGKAVFEAFYKKDLAKRLLMGRSASADAERSMLSRLKTECGGGFTQNLEQMFKDIELGREEMKSYSNRLDEMQKKPGGIDITVNVLASAAWPTYPDVEVQIPVAVGVAITEFEAHYKSKHGGRKLTWKHALASCQMKASFPKGAKEFVVSAYQAIVLLLFNGLSQDDYLTYEFIKTETRLPDAEVKRTLQSLACAKLRPLRKEPQGKEINDDDKFTINSSFSHPKYRVRINQVQLKETKQENKETHERVAEDRNFECQAAVVRIMKSRKTIGHSELVAEVIKATRSRGVLAVSDIKKNIDRLIEKDYMEREEGNMYNYVA